MSFLTGHAGGMVPKENRPDFPERLARITFFDCAKVYRMSVPLSSIILPIWFAMCELDRFLTRECATMRHSSGG